jgi:hypothetical protein
MLIQKPGNYGWPYCVTRDMPYVDYDFATGESGEPFDCRRPVNDSALNTGRRVLPPLVQPDVWYTYEDTGEFPELFQNAGGDGIGPMAGPAYQYDANSRSRFKWPRYYHGQPLAHIDFVRGNYTPVPQVGVFDATPHVTDSTGRRAAASVVIIIGNTAPVVELTTSPAPGEPFQFGQQVTYTVTDDSPVDCSTVTVGYILGHEEHGHPLSSSAGCTGTTTTVVDSGHAGASNLSAVFVASYTDAPEDPNVPPLTGSDEVVLVPNP